MNLLNRGGAAYNIRAKIIKVIIDNDLNNLDDIRSFVPYDDYYIIMALDYYISSGYKVVISKNNSSIYYFYNFHTDDEDVLENVLLLDKQGYVLAKNSITNSELELLEDFGFKKKQNG